MKRIASFTVNHDLLEKGMYISRIDGDVVTYDIRMKKPNAGDYLSMSAAHTIEHLFATFARNSKHQDSVIYFGPMGCRTGFYLLVRGLANDLVLAAVLDVLERIVAHNGEMFGQSRKECGNYRELSLDAAKTEAARYLEVLKAAKNDFVYPQGEML